MKNHLSTLPSIGAGGRFSPLGMLASWDCSTRSEELSTVELALFQLAGIRTHRQQKDKRTKTYRLMSPLGVFPAMRFFQDSAHSWITSRAYLKNIAVNVDSPLTTDRDGTHFLFLHSPEKANWFSGFPSGIL